MLKPFTVIGIIDNIDLQNITYGTIKLIEPDDDIADLNWIYIRANDESLNTNFDPRIGYFWRIIEDSSQYIVRKE